MAEIEISEADIQDREAAFAYLRECAADGQAAVTMTTKPERLIKAFKAHRTAATAAERERIFQACKRMIENAKNEQRLKGRDAEFSFEDGVIACARSLIASSAVEVPQPNEARDDQ